MLNVQEPLAPCASFDTVEHGARNERRANQLILDRREQIFPMERDWRRPGALAARGGLELRDSGVSLELSEGVSTSNATAQWCAASDAKHVSET